MGYARLGILIVELDGWDGILFIAPGGSTSLAFPLFGSGW
jgi:hypothetical protein